MILDFPLVEVGSPAVPCFSILIFFFLLILKNWKFSSIFVSRDVGNLDSSVEVYDLKMESSHVHIYLGFLIFLQKKNLKDSHIISNLLIRVVLWRIQEVPWACQPDSLVAMLRPRPWFQISSPGPFLLINAHKIWDRGQKLLISSG